MVAGHYFHAAKGEIRGNAAGFSRFVRERVDYLRNNNGMSDSVLRYMEKKRRPFGREVDYKLLFVYWKQFGEIKRENVSDNVGWQS